MQKAQIEFLNEKMGICKGRLILDDKKHKLGAAKWRRSSWNANFKGFPPLKTLHILLSIMFENIQMFIFIIMSS